jgi:predicted lipoprotein
VRDVRIGGFLGDEPGKDKPKQAVFWRSEMTIAAIRRNLAALARLFENAGIAGHLAEDRKWIAESIRFEFENADNALSAMEGRPIDALLADPEKRDRIAYARLVTSSLSDIIGGQLSAEFGLTAGFSSLDGD